MVSRDYIFHREEALFGDSGASKYMFRFVSLAYGILVLVLLSQLYKISGALYLYISELPGDLSWEYLGSSTVWRNGAPIVDALFMLVVLSGLWISYYLVILQSGQVDHRKYSTKEMVLDLAVLIGFYFTALSLRNMPEKAAIVSDTSWFGLFALAIALCSRLVLAMRFVPNAMSLEETLQLQAWTEMLVALAHGIIIVISFLWAGLGYDRLGMEVLKAPGIIVEGVLIYALLSTILLLYVKNKNAVEWRWAYRKEAFRFFLGGAIAIFILLVVWMFRGDLVILVLEHRGFFSFSVLAFLAMAFAMRSGPAIPDSHELGGGSPVKLEKFPRALCDTLGEIISRVYDEDISVAVLRWEERGPAGIVAFYEGRSVSGQENFSAGAADLREFADKLVQVDEDGVELSIQIGSIGLDEEGFLDSEFEVACRRIGDIPIPPCLVFPIIGHNEGVSANGVLVIASHEGTPVSVYREEIQELFLASCQLMARYVN